jgi:hypothetical protein
VGHDDARTVFPRRRAAGGRIDGIDMPAWSLLGFEDEMLLGTTEGVYRMRGTSTPVRISGTEDLSTYSLKRSVSDPSKIWLATRSGLASLHRDGDGWRFGGIVAGTPRYTRNIIEQNGELWLGTVFDGVIHIARDGKITRYGAGETSVESIGGRMVFVRNPGLIQGLGPKGTLVIDPLIGHVQNPPQFFRIAEDGAGNVWINSDPPRVLLRLKNTYARESRPLSGIGIDVQVMQYVDGAMWFATSEGLFRYAPHTTQRVAAQPAPLIRRVVAGERRTLVSEGVANGATELPYAFRRLRIEFAPASYRAGVAYQYRLDPVDSAWSEWSPNPFIDYTNLDEGRYTFRVRARGATGATSSEAQWSFTVHPPWYRTPWMLLLGLLLAAGSSR